MTTSRALWIVLVLALALVTGVVNYLVTRPSYVPEVRVADEDECMRGCRAAASCELAPTNCVARCQAEPALRACAGAGNCFAAARCFLGLTCGDQRPSGRGSCLGALECVADCPAKDLPCACRCSVTAQPNDTLKFARVGTCILNCGMDETCVRSRCESVIRACALD